MSPAIVPPKTERWRTTQTVRHRYELPTHNTKQPHDRNEKLPIGMIPGLYNHTIIGAKIAHNASKQVTRPPPSFSTPTQPPNPRPYLFPKPPPLSKPTLTTTKAQNQHKNISFLLKNKPKRTNSLQKKSIYKQPQNRYHGKVTIFSHEKETALPIQSSIHNFIEKDAKTQPYPS